MQEIHLKCEFTLKTFHGRCFLCDVNSVPMSLSSMRWCRVWFLAVLIANVPYHPVSSFDMEGRQFNGYEDFLRQIYHEDTKPVEQYAREMRASNQWCASSHECWALGGICIDIGDCGNHQFYTQVRGCKGDRKVCCMSFNFREVKDLSSLGFKGRLPWKKQTPEKPTKAQMETYETSKQSYKELFNIDLDNPQQYKRKDLKSDRRSAADEKQLGSSQIVDYDSKMAADYADFQDFFRTVRCEGDKCLNSVKGKINERFLEEDEPLYYNDVHDNLPNKGLRSVLMLIQQI